jgi:PAS domain S-box-containing protein
VSEHEPNEVEVRELLHAVDGIVLGLDPETLAIDYVIGGSAPLGWSSEMWRSSQFWTRLLHPLEAHKTTAMFAATARDGRDRRSVHRVRTERGQERWFSTRVRAFGGDGERPARLVVLMTDISEPLTVGSSLADRLDLQRLVLEQLPAIVYTTDRDLRFTSGAGAALAKLGLKPQQLLGVTIGQYYQTDDPEHPALARHRRALAGEMMTFDVELHGAVLENRLGPLRDESGAIIGTIGVCQDVTELRRGAAERAEQERRFAEHQRVLVAALSRRAAEWEAVLKSIVDGVVVFDNEGTVTFVNESGAQATAAAKGAGSLSVQQREQLLQLRQVDHTEFPDGQGLTARVLRGETIEATEVAYLARDGTRRFARVIGGPLRVNGERIGGVIVANDITKMKAYSAERERLLRDVTDRATEMQSVLDHLVDGVLVISREGELELANLEARKLLGLPDDGHLTIKDLNQRVVLHERDGAVSAPLEVAHARATAGNVVRNVQFQRLDGGMPRATLQLSAGPIRDGTGEVSGAVIVIRDVSDIAEFDQLKDQFIRVAAHELKTPVAVMKGYAQLLLRSSGEAPRAQLEAIDRGAKRIDRVVQELIDVSQLNLGTLSMTPAIVDLRALVASVAEHTPHRPKHRVRVVRSERALVRGDRYRLEFVLANLMDNAIRYSPAGGDVDVTLDVADGFAVVAVRDHGVGIAAGKQRRIFERFYRAHTDTPYDYGGMGVALSLSREIIERHGGTISFESKEGLGSTFTLRVPLGEDDG